MKVVMTVAAFNVEDLFDAWSEDVYNLVPRPDLTIFVENNSSDRTLEKLYTFKLPFEVIRFWSIDPKTLPFNCCYEIIVHVRQLQLTRLRQLDPDYGIFIDSDILIKSPDLITSLTDWNEDIVGGAYVRPYPWGEMLASIWKNPSGSFRYKRRPSAAFEEVWATSTGCLCLSRKIIQDRRLDFYPTIERSSEDYGYCIKARKLGYKVYLDSVPILCHRIRGNWKAWSIKHALEDGKVSKKEFERYKIGSW